MAVSVSSCSAFYTRHYTKGFYHEVSAKKPRVEQLPKAIEAQAFSSQAPKDTAEKKRNVTIPAMDEQTKPWIKPDEQHHFKNGNQVLPLNHNSLKKLLIPVKRSLQKIAKSGTSGDSPAGKAVLYILAIILALAIVALAIYLLPAVLIPEPVSSAFITLMIIVVIVVLVFLVLIICSLVKHLISLFRRKKTVPEDDF